MCTVMDLALAGVPHHFGFWTRRMVEPETEPILKGPPDRSIAGFTVGQVGLQPTFSITWAGTRLSKSDFQSAKRVLELHRHRVAAVGPGHRGDVPVAGDARHVGRGRRRDRPAVVPRRT